MAARAVFLEVQKLDFFRDIHSLFPIEYPPILQDLGQNIMPS